MNQPDFRTFPDLETSRLRLRKPALEDAADIFEFRSDPAVMQFIPRPIAKNLDDVIDLLKVLDDSLEKNERINWAIEWKDTGKVLGMIGYVNILEPHSRAEVGYALNRIWHRQGIITEALQAVVDFGFQNMALHSILAVIDAENIASGNLLERFGFRKEAHFMEDFFHDGHYRNSVHYGILQSEWKENMKPRSL